MKKVEKYITVYQWDNNGNKIPNTGKRISKEELEKADISERKFRENPHSWLEADFNDDDCIGELVSEKTQSNDPVVIEKEWLENRLATLEKLKREIVLKKYKTPQILSMYIAGQTEIINFFLQKKDDATQNSKDKQESGLTKRQQKQTKFKKHFIDWRSEHIHSSDNASIKFYTINPDVKKWYVKQKESIPKRATLQGWIK